MWVPCRLHTTAQVDGVRLYQDQAFHKMVGDKESPLHQDNYASPVGSNLTAGWGMTLIHARLLMHARLTLFQVVDSARAGDKGNGRSRVLRWVPPRRKAGHGVCRSGLATSIAADPCAWLQGFKFDESKLEAEFGPRVSPGATGMQPGDVTIHNGWTIHRWCQILVCRPPVIAPLPHRRANANRGSRTREAIAIQYFADGCVATRALHCAHAFAFWRPINSSVRNELKTQTGSYRFVDITAFVIGEWSGLYLCTIAHDLSPAVTLGSLSCRHDANSMSRWGDDIRPGQIIDSEYTPLVFSYWYFNGPILVDYNGDWLAESCVRCPLLQYIQSYR